MTQVVRNFNMPHQTSIFDSYPPQNSVTRFWAEDSKISHFVLESCPKIFKFARQTMLDLHNHTTRCKHATGTMSEYVDTALTQGVSVYGFACHAPMDYDTGFRMGFDELQDYFHDIEKLQERYSGRCLIRKGLEVDYLPKHLDSRVLDADVDYLIGSVHFLDDWGFDNPQLIGEYMRQDMLQCWQRYLHTIRDMAKSGLFQIVGHFDLLKIFNNPPDDSLCDAIAQTLESIQDAGMALEINSAGLRKPIGEIYPSKQILRKAFALGIPITFGSDAHAVQQVGFGRESAQKLAKDVGYTEMLDFHKRSPIVCRIP